ncbi:uncharacterized protein (DUF1330 family) [Hoeflea marina]|uniref:Uncharacterized protein (DUF1330 family) n=1 Tax=Hoeflea marina TaxID=274592 RepID=A0A317PJE7_9HYPH|nr:DUF1330 domain-containing protein [Hoeflea marina]PWW00473.1 uncharacterized protein (DUF1330 family) [Hoeflea marina]
MAKGYWIGRVDVRDAEAYKGYMAAAAPAYAEHGAVFLVRGGRFEAADGQARARNVVIEFPSYEAALACFQSETYQNARKIRMAFSEGDLIIIEGHDG